MPERLLSPAVYIAVLVVLLCLTILTVGLSFVPSSAVMRIVAGQSIAIVKASLVVLFFMHAPAQFRADAGRDCCDDFLARRRARDIDVQRLFHARHDSEPAGALISITM